MEFIHIHTHVQSLYDADIDAHELCEKLKELKMPGICITDHGAVSAIETYRRVFAKEGLKLVPGCELYLEGGDLGRRHLIVLAKDDMGWLAIRKLVSKSNENVVSGFPVLEVKDLASVMRLYRGHVVSTSACIQGPIGSVILSNGTLNRKIEKLEEKQKKYLSPSDSQYIEATDRQAALASEAQRLTEERNTLKVLADKKYAAREKKVEKLRAEGHPEYDTFAAELDAEKKESARAAIKLESVKTALEQKKKALTSVNQEVKKMNVSIDKWFSFEQKIAELKARLKSDEELFNAAKVNACTMNKIFGNGNFYMELQNHGIDEEKTAYQATLKIAKDLNLPVVASNDVHMLTGSEDDRLKRQVLRSLRFGKEFEEENTGDSELYIKSGEEVYNALCEIIPASDADVACENTVKIFNECNVEFKYGTHYPKFSDNAIELLKKEVEKGIKIRFPDGLSPEYKARMDREMKVICDMGYADYHLVVKDYIQYGKLLGKVPKDKLSEAPLSIDELISYIKDNGWENEPSYTIGTGRGSAVGSLVCYTIGITNLDPIKYELLFERFLNPERVSMPDIDVDFARGVREKCVQYVQAKYGESAVAGIMTVTCQAPKGALNIAAKFYGLKQYKEPMTKLGYSLADMVPTNPGTSFETTVDETGKPSDSGCPLYQYIKGKMKANKDALEILRWAKIIEGAFTAYGAHAAGIVITDGKPVSDYLPLRWNDKLGMMTTQCDMVELEEDGLLKFDFLGLKSLNVITDALKAIRRNHGITIDPLSIDIADKKVYEDIFQTARTKAVFQFESDGMRNMLKRFKPESFDDLIILNSMFRPGPLQYLDSVIDVKTGKKPISFLCPELKPILGKTYGAIVYQEQVMQIFQDLAGYSLGGADNVRRFMSKKKADKLALERKAFIHGDKERGIKGCVANGISAEVANTLFDQMMDFAAYAFNKSHAAAYSYNAYITAWLKEYYPAEFFAAALNYAADTEAITALVQEAMVCGIKVLAPSVNEADKTFSVQDGSVVFGLSYVAGVKNHADTILAERERHGSFRDFKDFMSRTNPNKTVVTNLIKAGAFDEFCKNRKALLESWGEIADVVSVINKKKQFVIHMNKLLPVIDSFSSDDELTAFEKENGIPASELKTLTASEKILKRIETAKETIARQTTVLKEIELDKSVEEDEMEKLNEEKSLLGMYISKHPIDLYPTAEELKVTPLGDISAETENIYGLVSGLKVKQRKKDGKDMAFFELDDKTGKVQACMFTKAYELYGELIKDGVVVKLTGNVNVEEDTTKFFVQSVQLVPQKKSSFFLPVSSKKDFLSNVDRKLFMETYGKGNGYPFYIYDEDAEKYIFVANVSKKICELPQIEELNI